MTDTLSPSKPPTHTSLSDSPHLQELAERLRADATQTEADLRPPLDQIDAAREAGVYGLTLPMAVGGEDAGFRDLFSVLRVLGAADASAAWIVGTSAVSKRLVELAFGTDVAASFIPPSAPSCGSGKPSGTLTPQPDGGWVLNGRWPMVSGGEIADGAALVAMAQGADGPVPMVVLLPASALVIDRDWDPVGMRGTGSHSVTVDGAHVPASAVAPFAFEPNLPAFGALTVLAPVLGAAQAALRETEDLLRTSSRRPTGMQAESIGHSPAARALLLDAAQALDDAVRRAEAACDRLERGAGDPAVALAVRSDFARSARQAREAVDRMLDLFGASALVRTSRMQRLWRDVQTGSRHAVLLGYVLDDQRAESSYAPVG